MPKEIEYTKRPSSAPPRTNRRLARLLQPAPVVVLLGEGAHLTRRAALKAEREAQTMSYSTKARLRLHRPSRHHLLHVA